MTRKTSKLVAIKAVCEKCGPFQVQRRRSKRKSTSGETYDLPHNVVCPTCRMWAEIIKTEEAN